MANLKRQRIRDPVHNVVEFDQGRPLERLLWEVIQTAPFQRLRRIRQLGFSDLVYPGATHSRFSHSIGVFHTARRLVEIVKRHMVMGPNEELQCDAALAAALVHDIGHGPFSHAFEQVGKAFGWGLAEKHELHSAALIQSKAPGSIGEILNRHADGFADLVADNVDGRANTVFRSVVSSQFDADRLDYVRRDRLMTGTGLAAIDLDWLIANLEIDAPPDQDGVQLKSFVLGRKALHAAEGFVTGLFQMYPNVYFHKTTRGAEKLMQAMLARVGRAVQDGRGADTGLAKDHPLIRLAKSGGTVEVLADLDDFVIWGSLPTIQQARDRDIAMLAERLSRRRLFKCKDVGAAIERAFRGEAAEVDDREFTARTEEAKARLAEWANENGADRILCDEVKRQPYKPLSAEGPLNQIWIRDGGDLVDLQMLSPAVRATRPCRLFRVYTAEEDEPAKRFVDDIVARATRRET